MLDNFNFNASIPNGKFPEELIGHVLSLWVKSEVLQEQLCEIISHLKNEPLDKIQERYDQLEGDKRVDYRAFFLKKYPADDAEPT